MSLETQRNKNHIWSEKHRPRQMSEVVLNSINQTLLTNVIESGMFPNLLLFGPPGTGKTTTIFNLIRAYQEKHEKVSRELCIHLNASDDRGIDVIRNQIHQFVHSKGMFHKGTKFVVLDEVDSTTRNAQHALKYLMQSCLCNPSIPVRFCLICNYLCKIDVQLQTQFVCLKYDQLDPSAVRAMLTDIVKKEDVEAQWTDENVQEVQEQYQSDVRSMINALQYSRHLFGTENRLALRAEFCRRWEEWVRDVCDASPNILKAEAWADECMELSRRASLRLDEMVKQCVVDWMRSAQIPAFLHEPEIVAGLGRFLEAARTKAEWAVAGRGWDGTGAVCMGDQEIRREWIRWTSEVALQKMK